MKLKHVQIHGNRVMFWHVPPHGNWPPMWRARIGYHGVGFWGERLAEVRQTVYHYIVLGKEFMI